VQILQTEIAEQVSDHGKHTVPLMVGIPTIFKK
jgi:hypothetical protein